MSRLLAIIEAFPWDKFSGVGGGVVLGAAVWAFITDRIRTTSSAQQEIDGWKEIAQLERARADKAEERMLATLHVARKASEAAETAVVAAKQQHKEA